MSYRPTHDELVERAVKWLVGSGGCRFAVPEIDVPLVWEHPDAIGWMSLESTVLVECKVSRNDFLKDMHKDHRMNPQRGLGRERWYMCRPGLISKDELPNGWGLLYCHPKVIRKEKHAGWRGFEERNKMGERLIMFALLRRAMINGALNQCLSPTWRTKLNGGTPEVSKPVVKEIPHPGSKGYTMSKEELEHAEYMETTGKYVGDL